MPCTVGPLGIIHLDDGNKLYAYKDGDSFDVGFDKDFAQYVAGLNLPATISINFGNNNEAAEKICQNLLNMPEINRSSAFPVHTRLQAVADKLFEGGYAPGWDTWGQFVGSKVVGENYYELNAKGKKLLQALNDTVGSIDMILLDDGGKLYAYKDKDSFDVGFDKEFAQYVAGLKLPADISINFGDSKHIGTFANYVDAFANVAKGNYQFIVFPCGSREEGIQKKSNFWKNVTEERGRFSAAFAEGGNSLVVRIRDPKRDDDTRLNGLGIPKCKFALTTP